MSNRFRRLRAALGNAVLWGIGWSTMAFAIFSILHVVGIIPETASWLYGLGLAFRFGIVGAVAGAAFSTVVRLVYHGQRLSDISWVRFGLAGGVVTAVFVPLFLQTMNLLSGDGLVPWRLVLDDSLWTGVFGGIAAGGSLRIAQRVGAVSAGKSPDRLDAAEPEDRLAAAEERDIRRTSGRG